MDWVDVSVTRVGVKNTRIEASGIRLDQARFSVSIPVVDDGNDCRRAYARLDTYRDCVCSGIVTCALHVRLKPEWDKEDEEKKSFRNPDAVKGHDRQSSGDSAAYAPGSMSATAVDEFDPIPVGTESAKEKFSHPQIKGWPELDGSARRKLREVNALIDLYRREFGRVAGDQIFERTVKVVIE